MKLKMNWMTLPLAALLFAGCSDGDGDDMGVADMGVNADMGGNNNPDMGSNPDMGMNMPPAPPTLGTQIDRAGRPAITTGLIAPFAADMDQVMPKNNYNAASFSMGDQFQTEIRANLAIYDSLDTVCGNQAFADMMEMGPERYDTLANALALDVLVVNSDNGTCSQYLGVELGVMTDCGGRAPSYDVMDVTYSALAIGMASGVGDGVDSDDAAQSDTTFPFLAAP